MKLVLNQLVDIIQPLKSDDGNLDRTAYAISTDTRTIGQNEIFVALRGEQFDGHNFLELAVAQGAIAVIVDHDVSAMLPNTVAQFVVEDTLQAYQALGHWWRKQFGIPVIGITGSVGKTTTKEIVAAVLGTRGQVLKTEANYNNEIGVPKTLLGLKSEHNYAVIEMAMRARGEIALLTEIADPTIGLITNVGTAHIGRLGSREAIAMAKCELLGNMSPHSVAILNHDQPLLMATAAKVWQGETITYGLEGGDLHGQMIDSNTLRLDGLDFTLPLPGNHNASNYLAALAVAKVLGIDWKPLTQGITVSLPQGRSQRHQLANDILLLDETYNAGLESMLAALELLKQTPGQRHIAVLGTMKELGEHSAQIHQQVGKKAKELELDYLLILTDDPEASAIAQGASGINTECYNTHAEIVTRLQQILQPRDRVLLKASNSVGLNKVVTELLKTP